MQPIYDFFIQEQKLLIKGPEEISFQWNEPLTVDQLKRITDALNRAYQAGQDSMLKMISERS